MMIVSNKPTLHTPIHFIEKAFNSLFRTNPIDYKNINYILKIHLLCFGTKISSCDQYYYIVMKIFKFIYKYKFYLFRKFHLPINIVAI